MAHKGLSPAPREVKSVLSGAPITYRGYGRVPKYTPAEAKERQRERAKDFQRKRAAELQAFRAAVR